jgi:hypothetical protein
MLVTWLGIVTLVKPVQQAKAYGGIVVISLGMKDSFMGAPPIYSSFAYTKGVLPQFAK